MASVLQPWVEEIPIRMQSTLLLGLRGPDTHHCPNLKTITRWLRAHTFKPGNPSNVTEFMCAEPMPIVEKGPVARELEFCSQHYYSHLMHSLEVVAYRHPDADVQRTAMELFIGICALFHLGVELRCEFEHRLREIQWEGGQPNTLEEAFGRGERQ